MAEIIGAKVQVDAGEAVKSVGTLRQQLKASLTDLQAMQEQFGDVSPEALKAAQSVAGLRDAIKDANEVAELFNPEKKFQAVVGVMQGIASGFAAAQGAMALFGVESEQVEKQILKVQAAMSLAQGLSGLKAATEDFKRFGAVVANLSIIQKANNAINVLAAGIMKALGIATSTTSLAFNALKTAIITTGIGALVIVLGTAIQKISDLAKSTGDAAKAQKALNDELEKTANTFTDEIVDVYEQQRQLEVARAKAVGKSEAEIVEINRKANEEITRTRRVNYLQQLGDGLDANAAKKELNKQETENELFELGVQQKAREDAEKKQQEARDKAAQDAEKARAKRDADAKAAAEKSEADAKVLSDIFTKSLDDRDKADIEFDEKKKQQDAEFEAYQHEIANKQYEESVKQSDAQILLAQREKEAKIAGVMAVAGALNSFAALAGEQTAAGKAFSVASATIQAILGAQQAFTAMSAIPIVGPALGAVAAAGAIAAGIANVKKILAVQVPGKGAAGGANLPSLSNTAAPLTPSRPATPTTRLDQDTINNIGNAVPVRAYVVESDITNSQQRMVRIKNAAKFE